MKSIFQPFWISTRWAVIPLIIGFALSLTYPDFRWVNEIFHGVIESAGALIGFGLAYIIYSMIVRNQLPTNFVWLIACFIMMGALDIVHSLHQPGQLFVWFHSLATFFGGILASLIWRSAKASKKYLSRSYLYVVMLIAFSITLISSYWPDIFLLPMIDSDGEFTPQAIFLNITGGIGFIASWFYFMRDYQKNNNPESPYFSNYLSLFGLAGLIFELSALWDGNWWLWHMLRSTAYLFLLSHFAVSYQKTLTKNLDESEQHLLDVENRYQAIVNASPDWIWEVDINGVYTYASPRVQELLGYRPEEVVGKKVFDLMPAEEATRVMAIFSEIARDHKPIQNLENVNLHRNGQHVVLETSGVPILSTNGFLLGYRGIDRDITKRKQLETELKDAAQRDPLTGAWNRRQFESFLADAHAQVTRYGHPYSLLLIDVDHFKSVNDRFGHDVGDKVLVKLCDTLTSRMRETDNLCRWGGEEFIILLPQTSLENGHALAENLRQTVNQLSIPPLESISISISIGVAQFKTQDKIEQVIKRADEALFRAKANGRNRVELES